MAYHVTCVLRLLVDFFQVWVGRLLGSGETEGLTAKIAAKALKCGDVTQARCGHPHRCLSFAPFLVIGYLPSLLVRIRLTPSKWENRFSPICARGAPVEP